ncbi:alcohol dehydrogenase catalytic domain-containing protein [Nocardia vinacea]|uniref:Alcohol dehydrogenase catalytic domain-containing protein n=1 Tax=Nocardia vinacea TaxID=96468 RepID=A0ABZ1YXF2_9NOCA|nr:alcohol dehydrogenase catalytic domain-containing protein [Nocardia vinacea]
MTMLAARAHQDSNSLTLEQIPIPEPRPLDVVIKVVSAGLAPGMMNLLKMGAFKHLPTTLGHEAAGIVAAVGDQVVGVTVGDRVRMHPNLNCRNCDYCRTDRDMMCAQQAMIGHAGFGGAPMPLYERYHDGALAEYVRVPHWLIDQLPANISFDVAAKVHDLANVVRILKCAQLPLGATVVATAATGTMGTATIKLAEHFGISRLLLVGRSAERLEAVTPLAGRVEVDTVALDQLPEDWETSGGLTRRLRELAPEGVHAVLDYIPTGAATSQTMAALRTGGVLAHMGGNTTPLALPPIALMINCWRFVGTRACTRSDTEHVLTLLGSGALTVDELITQRYPLANVETAVEAMVNRKEPMWMTVVNP